MRFPSLGPEYLEYRPMSPHLRDEILCGEPGTAARMAFAARMRRETKGSMPAVRVKKLYNDTSFPKTSPDFSPHNQQPTRLTPLTANPLHLL